MRSTNFVQVIGNIGADLKSKQTPNGTDVVAFTVAENVSKQNAEGVYEQTHTNWIPVTAFGALAKRAEVVLKKGDRVSVAGTLKTGSYEKDGRTVYTFELVADSIEKSEHLGRRNTDGAQASGSGEQRPA